MNFCRGTWLYLPDQCQYGVRLTLTEEKKKVLTRVRRIRGQIDALERALENGAECRAILQQIAAVRGASNGLMAEVLESHIRETFDQNDNYSHEVSKSVDDTIELVRAYLK